MKTISFVALIIFLTGLFGYISNLPQDVGLDVPDGKLNSLSFAPFREGQGPLDGVFPSTAEMEEDMQLMGQKTHTIRTYASSEGNMPALPLLAKKYGLNMLQGAWLGMGAEDNQIEINALIKAANAYPDVIKRVIVGNEVLLRGDLKPEQLVEYIRMVKRAVKQPVSYADVWSMYMKYPQLIKEVDFITIHILPYWEDEPIDVDLAPAHIERIYKQVQKEANAIKPGIPILIGESGWPGAGRQRGYAVPSVVNEAKFIRGLIKVAKDNGFDVNIVEALNQSWKSELEGVVGANWGLYSVDRQEVFPLTGSVYEHPHWLREKLIAIGLFLVTVCLFWRHLQVLPALPLFGLLAFTQLLWVLWVNQVGHLWYTSYSDWQRLQTLLLVGINVLLGGFIVQHVYALLCKRALNLNIGEWFNLLYWLVIAYALFKAYCFATYSRYVSFPTESTSIAVVGVIGLMLASFFTSQSKTWPAFNLAELPGGFEFKSHYHRLVGITLLSLGMLMVVEEIRAFVESRDFTADHPVLGDRLRLAVSFTLNNKQLLAWLFSICILAMPLLASKILVGSQLVKIMCHSGNPYRNDDLSITSQSATNIGVSNWGNVQKLIGISFLIFIGYAALIKKPENKGLPPSVNANFTMSAPIFSQAEQPLPPTGASNASFGNGAAPLIIRTSTSGGYHYFVKIVNKATNQELGTYFIRSGGVLDTTIPIGNYEIKYATGHKWYGYSYLFGPETTYSRADSVFSFTFDGHQYSGNTIELIMQQNGNLRTTGIKPNQW